MKRLLLLLGDLRETPLSRTSALRSLVLDQGRRELRLTWKALAGGWPGLLLFVLVMLVAFTVGAR
jgi:hypothetical protein